ncbi:MAG: hypothetical protein IT382_06875 [Deltaproteobacteria bacterium]|nr:hypothetical protein [Deltaproteobacteria bacterium]
MAKRAEARVFRESASGTSLEEIARCCGALPPAAVCRIGRQVALALVTRHDREERGPHGGIALDRVRVMPGGEVQLLEATQPALRTVSPERRAGGRRAVADDLWALGVLLADLALAGAMLDEDRLSEANPELPPRLKDALHMLVAREEERLTNASAAVCMLTEVEKDFGDGALLVRAALARTRGVDAAALTGPPTAHMSAARVLSASAIRALNELGQAPTLPDAPPTPAHRFSAPASSQPAPPPPSSLPPVEIPRWVVPAIAVAIVVVVVLAIASALF